MLIYDTGSYDMHQSIYHSKDNILYVLIFII